MQCNSYQEKQGKIIREPKTKWREVKIFDFFFKKFFVNQLLTYLFNNLAFEVF